MEGGSGRTPIAPEILFSLWLYATVEGVGSARTIARLTEAHDAYRWICGGVQVNHHTLSDFRGEHEAEFNGLLTDSVAALLAVKAVELKRVAQDGMRVRASAGASSFRRRGTLERCLEEARTQIETLKRQVEDDPGVMTRRQQAARERAQRERQERIEQALQRLPELEKLKEKQGKKTEDARASTTDAEATVMKMGDGGFRPAYNAQYATDTETQVIVGVEVSTAGSDMGQLVPMIDQVNERYSKNPQQWLIDGGYPAHNQLDQAETKTCVYAPIPKSRDDASDPCQPKPGDSQAVRDWRQRMGTDEARKVYKERARNDVRLIVLIQLADIHHARTNPAESTWQNQGAGRIVTPCASAQLDANLCLSARIARIWHPTQSISLVAGGQREQNDRRIRGKAAGLTLF